MHEQENVISIYTLYIFDLVLDMVQEIILGNTIANVVLIGTQKSECQAVWSCMYSMLSTEYIQTNLPFPLLS